MGTWLRVASFVRVPGYVLLPPWPGRIKVQVKVWLVLLRGFLQSAPFSTGKVLGDLPRLLVQQRTVYRMHLGNSDQTSQ